MSHTVKAHLGIHANDYDRAIRTLIPGYDAMRDAQLEWLGRVIPPDGRVLDLGGGTGGLALAIAGRFPEMRVQIWDIDPAMLAVAAHRTAEVAARVTCVEKSYEGKLPACDAVVASLSLHHVPDMRRKWEIYSNVYEALKKPGVFLNADPTIPTSPVAQATMYDAWAEFQIANGYTDEQARGHFETWKLEDFYKPLHEELEALKAAGFPEPNVFWKQGPMTVYGGVKG